METTVCPLCRTPLELKQISFTSAIYICTDLKCPYPVDHKCLVVERHLEGPKNNPSSRSPVTGNLEYMRPPVLPLPVVKTEETSNGVFDLNEAVSHALETFDLQAVEDRSFNLIGNASVPSSCNNNVSSNENSYYNDEYSQSHSNGNQNFTDLEEIFNGLM